MSETFFAQNFFTGDGQRTSWEFSFAGQRGDNVLGSAYLSKEDVLVATLDYSEQTITRAPIPFEWIGPNTILIEPAIQEGQEFVIYRESSPQDLLVDFTDFSTVTEEDLDAAYRHPVYLAQETRDLMSDLRISLDNLATFLKTRIDDVEAESREEDLNLLNTIRDLANKVESRIRGVENDYTAADANLQAQITGDVPLEASAFSPISWHDKVIKNSVTIPSGKNAWSFGPYLTLNPGVVVEISEDSTWTLAEGLQDNRLLGYDEGTFDGD